MYIINKYKPGIGLEVVSRRLFGSKGENPYWNLISLFL